MSTQSIAPRTDGFAALTSAAEQLGIDTAMAAMAAGNLLDGSARFLVVSGKLCSGKDSVAPEVLSALGISSQNTSHHYYANYLKDEVDDMLTCMRVFETNNPDPMSARSREALAEILAANFNLPKADAQYYAGDLYTEFLTTPGLHARMRTVIMRKVLQHHGTNCRRAQNENYWVSRALGPVYEDLAAGRTVFVTDARFPNEVDGAASLGAFTARLDISREEQVRRLQSRDGLGADLSVLEHKSETALDDYDGFDIRVLNEGRPMAQTVADIAAAMTAARVA